MSNTNTKVRTFWAKGKNGTLTISIKINDFLSEEYSEKIGGEIHKFGSKPELIDIKWAMCERNGDIEYSALVIFTVEDKNANA